MYFDNFMRLALVSLSYVILIFGLGAFLLKPMVQKRSISDRILMYFISGNFYVMNMVFLLLFFKLNSRIVTILALLAGALGIRLLYDYKSFAMNINARVETLALLVRGVYGWKYFWKTKISAIGDKINHTGKLIFTKYLFETVMIAGCFGIQAYYMGYRYVKYATFATSDEPVHLNWIQDMVVNGNLYFEGEIYPHGLHNIVYALIKVFNFKAYTAYRNFGFIMVMCLLLMLLLLIKRVYRSGIAPLVGLFLYVSADIFNDIAWDRLMYCIPMEYGILFLYPMVIFLYNYICRKGKLDLIHFGMCFAMTLYVHSYDGILALILCFSIGIAGFYRIIKNKIFFKLILIGLLSGIVGMLPIGIGLLSGLELQGSFNWAANVIQGTVEKTDLDSIQKEENQSASNNMSVDKTEQSEENQVTTTDISQETDHSIINKIKVKTKGYANKLKGAVITCYNQTTFYLMKNNNSTILILLIFAMVLTCIRALIHILLRSKQEELFLQLGITFYVLILLVMMCSEQLGLTVIIENKRISGCVAYAFPLLLGIPLEYLYLLAKSKKWTKRLVNTIIITITSFAVIFIYYGGYVRPMGRCYVVNSNSAANVFNKIVQNYQDYKWHIISTVDEYSLVQDVGRHWELLTFITDLSNYSPTMRIVFPTQDVFLFVEKRPIVPNEIIRVNEVKQYPEITEKDAMEKIGNYFYTQRSDFYKYNRNMIMAKAKYWAEKYMSYFPNEMSVFYEDDDFICYHLKQETDYLNNLAIDYEYN